MFLSVVLSSHPSFADRCRNGRDHGNQRDRRWFRGCLPHKAMTPAWFSLFWLKYSADTTWSAFIENVWSAYITISTRQTLKKWSAQPLRLACGVGRCLCEERSFLDRSDVWFGSVFLLEAMVGTVALADRLFLSSRALEPSLSRWYPLQTCSFEFFCTLILFCFSFGILEPFRDLEVRHSPPQW